MRNGRSKALAAKTAQTGGAQAHSQQPAHDATVARARTPQSKPPAQPGKAASQAANRDQTSQPTQTPERRIVFISHANPEDNPAAGWFATQLTLLGYEVWCDLKSTHGGESDFWLKVQKTIENDAVKFVYLLSNASCDFEKKKGIYKEVQAADNLKQNNFIIPVMIEKVTRSRPILVNTSIYIDGENWANGLRDLVERLTEDGVPKRADIDFEKISSWWPATSVDNVILTDTAEELVTDILSIKALPEKIHLLKVFSEGNLLAGFERLRGALPNTPAFYAHGDYTLTFASQSDLATAKPEFTFQTAYALDTREFLASGHKGAGIAPDIARNIVTYLVGQAWDGFMISKNLLAKPMSRSNRSIWYLREGQLPNNRARITEPGRRTVPIQLVGTVQHFKKAYRWHFGIYPTVDLRVHSGIILSPKALLSLPRKRSELGTALDDAEKAPFLVDDKKALKALNWWNKGWRQRLLAMISWLSDGQPEIVIPVASQQIVVSAAPQTHTASKSFMEMSDDDVVNKTLEAILERTPAS
jgi:hypothetical protein